MAGVSWCRKGHDIMRRQKEKKRKKEKEINECGICGDSRREKKIENGRSLQPVYVFVLL